MKKNLFFSNCWQSTTLHQNFSNYDKNSSTSLKIKSYRSKTRKNVSTPYHKPIRKLFKHQERNPVNQLPVVFKRELKYKQIDQFSGISFMQLLDPLQDPYASLRDFLKFHQWFDEQSLFILSSAFLQSVFLSYSVYIWNCSFDKSSRKIKFILKIVFLN